MSREPVKKKGFKLPPVNAKVIHLVMRDIYLEYKMKDKRSIQISLSVVFTHIKTNSKAQKILLKTHCRHLNDKSETWFEFFQTAALFKTYYY